MTKQGMHPGFHSGVNVGMAPRYQMQHHMHEPQQQRACVILVASLCRTSTQVNWSHVRNQPSRRTLDEDGPAGFTYMPPQTARPYTERLMTGSKSFFQDQGKSNLHYLRLACTTPRTKYRSAEEVKIMHARNVIGARHAGRDETTHALMYTRMPIVDELFVAAATYQAVPTCIRLKDHGQQG
jgi:hypothetical protein